jgi:hypothetical protein
VSDMNDSASVYAGADNLDRIPVRSGYYNRFDGAARNLQWLR